MENGLSKGELIRIFFTEGLKYADIILALYSRHNIKLCLRQLKRILRSLGLQRRPQNYSTTQAVENAIIRECNLSGECVGYRNMWKRLLRDHGIIAKRNDVMTILRHLYPKATEEMEYLRWCTADCSQVCGYLYISSENDENLIKIRQK